MEQGKQMRFSQAEIELIQNTFAGEKGEHLLKLMRKVFLPEYDPTAPLGQAFDLWMTMDVRGMNPDQAYIHMLARNSIITHVEQMLLQLSLLSLRPKSKEEVEQQNKQDSTQ